LTNQSNKNCARFLAELKILVMCMSWCFVSFL
jgi:hypothetical protein